MVGWLADWLVCWDLRLAGLSAGWSCSNDWVGVRSIVWCAACFFGGLVGCVG